MSTSMTLADAIEQTGKDVYDYLDRQSTVPVISKAACQGDVAILRVTTRQASTPIPADGVVLVRSDASAHAHTLHGQGFFDPAPVSRTALSVGTITAPEDSDVLISHPEHGALLLAPGTYRVSRQREQADELRMVQD